MLQPQPASGHASPVEDDAPDRRIQVREQILNAAEAVFAEEGEDGLSMRRLAERINYSPAAIYNYFRNKDELIDGLRDAFFNHLLVRLEASIPHQASRENITACLQTYIQCGLEKPFHYAMGFSKKAAVTPLEDPSKTMGHNNPESAASKAYVFLMEMVEGAMQSGMFAKADPELVCHSVWSSIHGMTMLLIQFPGYVKETGAGLDRDQSEMISFHIETLLRGLEPKAGS